MTDVLPYDTEPFDLWEREELEWDQIAARDADQRADGVDQQTGLPVSTTDLREVEIGRMAERRALQLEADQRGKEIATERIAAKRRVEHAEPLDWQTFLTEKIHQPPFFVGKLIAEGQHCAMVGAGKAGKSLIVLDMAYRIAAGLPFLGDGPRPKRRVLYVDQENGRYDIQSRLLALGAKPEQLSELVYMSFPAFRPLDTPAGAADLIAEVDRHEPALVILDTISRMIEGKENDSDPWRDMYRLFLIEMKRRERGSFRLDHFGKDEGKGGRGSSAKDQDVDAVWELKVAEKGGNRLTLTRSHTRSGIGPPVFEIERHGELVADQWRPGATRHVVVDGMGSGSEFVGAATIADQLTAAGIPVDLSRDKVRAILKAQHPNIRCTNDMLSAALKLRRAQAGLRNVSSSLGEVFDLDEAA